MNNDSLLRSSRLDFSDAVPESSEAPPGLRGTQIDVQFVAFRIRHKKAVWAKETLLSNVKL
jgi:hypothetical protein